MSIDDVKEELREISTVMLGMEMKLCKLRETSAIFDGGSSFDACIDGLNKSINDLRMRLHKIYDA